MKPQLKNIAPASWVLRALILGIFSTPAMAQVTPICDLAEPAFLAEGPISAATGNGSGGGTITAMGVTFQVLPGTPVASATAKLTMDQFASTTPFPGRTQPGFLGATVIATGCVKNGVAVADDVFSDVNENVMLGVVTGPLVLAANGSKSFAADGTTVKLLTDARMPAGPITNDFGFPVVETSLVVGANVALEGYFSNDGSNVMNAWTVETDGVLVAPTTPQVSVQRFRCARDIELRGGIFPADAGGVCNFAAQGLSLALFDGAGLAIPYDAAKDLDVVNGVAPAAAFCSYRLRPAITQCPAEVKLQLLRNGVPVAETTAP